MLGETLCSLGFDEQVGTGFQPAKIQTCSTDLSRHWFVKALNLSPLRQVNWKGGCRHRVRRTGALFINLLGYDFMFLLMQFNTLEIVCSRTWSRNDFQKLFTHWRFDRGLEDKPLIESNVIVSCITGDLWHLFLSLDLNFYSLKHFSYHAINALECLKILRDAVISRRGIDM